MLIRSKVLLELSKRTEREELEMYANLLEYVCNSAVLDAENGLKNATRCIAIYHSIQQKRGTETPYIYADIDVGVLMISGASLMCCVMGDFEKGEKLWNDIPKLVKQICHPPSASVYGGRGIVIISFKPKGVSYRYLRGETFSIKESIRVRKITSVSPAWKPWGDYAYALALMEFGEAQDVTLGIQIGEEALEQLIILYGHHALVSVAPPLIQQLLRCGFIDRAQSILSQVLRIRDSMKISGSFGYPELRRLEGMLALRQNLPSAGPLLRSAVRMAISQNLPIPILRTVPVLSAIPQGSNELSPSEWETIGVSSRDGAEMSPSELTNILRKTISTLQKRNSEEVLSRVPVVTMALRSLRDSDKSFPSPKSSVPDSDAFPLHPLPFTLPPSQNTAKSFYAPFLDANSSSLVNIHPGTPPYSYSTSSLPSTLPHSPTPSHSRSSPRIHSPDSPPTCSSTDSLEFIDKE